MDSSGEGSILPQEADGKRRYPVEFTATAGEYFRIWIVNLALTILTLGIYSAWAKVRKKRYFYGHTRIDGEGFEYRANPVAILKGRIIAVGLFSIYSLTQHFQPLLHLALAFVLAGAIPWLIVRSLMFNAYNSAYRNIRFHFRGNYGEIIKILFWYGLLAALTLGLMYPYMKSRLARFIMGNHRYGETRFEVGNLTRRYYAIYLKGLVLLVPTLIFLGILVAVGAPLLKGSKYAAVIFVILAFYGSLLPIFAYGQSRINNLIWNSTAMGPVHFESRLRARDLMGLYFTNIVAIVCTLGLAAPWAIVRTMRYRASKMTMVSTGALDHFVAAEAAQVSATGEEIGEMFDIDIGW
ncbi:MAG TPA: YjgN family protein [Burkholderiales bacterium]|nr:YjgN family protein [Burkholderiales bacterium]